MVTVSIIVPVYNVEPYLKKCLSSIRESNFGDYEVILVDDGSTDRSGAICDEFVSLDSRFSVYHLENGGVSHARNFGMDRALGEFLVFIDSDDSIGPDYLSDILIAGEEDYVFCGYKDVYQGKVLKEHRFQDEIISVEELRRRVNKFGKDIFPCAVWKGCYKRAIIVEHGIRFDEGISLGEDLLFNIHYLEKCRTIRIDSSTAYYYEQVPSSLIHRYYPEMLKKQELETSSLEAFSGGPNMRWRYYWWHRTISHYQKHLRSEDKVIREDARAKLRQCYHSAYFRASIPVIRSKGTTDERIETYLMHYRLHGFFPLFCTALEMAVRVKRRVLK